MSDNIESGIQEGIGEIYKTNPNVFLIVRRELNNNVVVYEAVLGKKREVTGVRIYWVLMSTPYRKKQDGGAWKTDPLNRLDNYAYGIKIKNKRSCKGWDFTFRRCPKRVFTIVVYSSGVSCFTNHDGAVIRVNDIHIHERSLFGVSWPSVDKVKINGYDTSRNTVSLGLF